MSGYWVNVIMTCPTAVAICVRRQVCTFVLLQKAMQMQGGAADTEIKVPSGENTEFKRSPFKVWSRSEYN